MTVSRNRNLGSRGQDDGLGEPEFGVGEAEWRARGTGFWCRGGGMADSGNRNLVSGRWVGGLGEPDFGVGEVEEALEEPENGLEEVGWRLGERF